MAASLRYGVVKRTVVIVLQGDLETPFVAQHMLNSYSLSTSLLLVQQIAQYV